MQKDGKVRTDQEEPTTHCKCGSVATTVKKGVPLCDDCVENVEDESAEKIASAEE